MEVSSRNSSRTDDPHTPERRSKSNLVKMGELFKFIITVSIQPVIDFCSMIQDLVLEPARSDYYIADLLEHYKDFYTKKGWDMFTQIFVTLAIGGGILLALLESPGSPLRERLKIVMPILIILV